MILQLLVPNPTYSLPGRGWFTGAAGHSELAGVWVGRVGSRPSRDCSRLWWPSDISDVQVGAAGAWGQIAEPQPSALRRWIKWNRGGNSWHTNGHVCLHPQINQFSAFLHCRQRQFVQQLPERKFTGQLKVLTFKQCSRGGVENYWVWNANRFNSFIAIYMTFTHSQLFSSLFFCPDFKRSQLSQVLTISDTGSITWSALQGSTNADQWCVLWGRVGESKV